MIKSKIAKFSRGTLLALQTSALFYQFAVSENLRWKGPHMNVRNITLNTLSLLAIGFGASSSFAGVQLCTLGVDCVHIEINSSPIFNGTEVLDARHTGAQVLIGNTDINEILGNEFNVPTFDYTQSTNFIVNFRLTASLAPLILRSRAQGQANDKIDEFAKAARGAALREAKGKIAYAIANDPKYKNLPAPYQTKIKEQMLAGATVAIDQQVAIGKEMKRDEVDKRLDKVELETSIQQVALIVGKVFGEEKLLVFVKAGKFTPETGASVNSAGETYLESQIVGSDLTQHGAGTMGTTGVEVGLSKIIGKDVQLRLDFFMLHDRDPWTSGTEATVRALSESEDTFHDHQAWTHIDSQVVRALIRNNRAEAYVSCGNFNGATQCQVGGRLDVTTKAHIVADYTEGERDIVGSAVSVFGLYDLTERLTIFLGYEKDNDFYNPMEADNREGVIKSETKLTGGGTFTVFKDLKIGPAFATAKATVEAVKKSGNGLSDDRSGVEPQGGLNLNVYWW